MSVAKYVAGFLFNEEMDRVALIRKNRPEWQAGKFNGIGGKVEDVENDTWNNWGKELASQAMIREFEEETGMKVTEWNQLCLLKSADAPGWHVYFYWAIGDLSKLNTLTDEVVEVFHLYELNELHVIPNIRWLIPMAVDMAKSANFKPVTINEIKVHRDSPKNQLSSDMCDDEE